MFKLYASKLHMYQLC